MILADVIMPFTAVYYAWVWCIPFNILALAAEVIVFRKAYREMPFLSACLNVFGANSISFVFGCVLFVFIESYLEFSKGFSPFGGNGPTWAWDYYLILGVALAYILSVYFELRYWQVVYRKRSLPNLDRVCALANLVSYSVLLGPPVLFVGITELFSH